MGQSALPYVIGLWEKAARNWRLGWIKSGEIKTD